MDQKDLEGIDKCLLEEVSIANASHPIRENLELIPAGEELSEVERLAEGGSSRGMKLRNALKNNIEKYDYVLIDCPPSSGLLVVNAIFATQKVLIPMTGDYLALQGLSHLMATLKNFGQALGYELKQWLVLSRFQARRRLSQEVRDKLILHFPGKVLATEISESVVLAESPGYGETIFEYKPSSKSALEYESLVDDLIIGRTH
jgi:chromosome partitioning protein